MDDIDKRIIKLLNNNSRVSITQISKEVNVSRPSVENRIERLISEEIIKSFTIDTSLDKIGYEISFYVLISDINIKNEVFREILINNKFIVEVNCVTGKANYVVKAATPTMDKMNELLCELRKYAQIETLLILHNLVEERLLELI
ncbi:MAG: AsnC family transcriptional regulator [Erysipelotrichales bacterium]